VCATCLKTCHRKRLEPGPQTHTVPPRSREQHNKERALPQILPRFQSMFRESGSPNVRESSSDLKTLFTS